MLRTWFGVTVGFGIVCAVTAVTSADVVILTDGSRLVGTVKQIADGKLTLETAFSEAPLLIDSSLVTSLLTAEAVTVETPDGRQLTGKLDWDPGNDEGVMRAEGGDVTIGASDLAIVWPAGEKSPSQLAKEAELAKKQAKWSARIELGGVVEQGNTESVEGIGKIEVRRKSEQHLLRLYTSGEYGEDNEIRNTAEAKAGVYGERLFGERLFGFARSELEYDEFEGVDLRSTTSGGPGYYLIKRDEQELKIRGGLGYQFERFSDGTDSKGAVVDAGLDYRLDIADWLQFTNTTNYLPRLDDIQNYLLSSDFAFLTPLGGSDRLKLKVGALFEYNSRPEVGTERLDEKFYANLVFELN